MKNLFLLLFFFCISATSLLHAKPYPWKQLPLDQQADSLKSAINRLDKNNLDSIITLSIHLRQIAEKLNKDNFKAFAIKEMAWAYQHKQSLGQSTHHYFQLERLYQQLGDTAGLGIAFYNIGLIFAKAHEYDKSIYYLDKARDHFDAAGQPYKVGYAQYAMAKRYIEKGDPKTATELLFKALKKCPDDKYSFKSMIYNRLGWAAKDQEEYDNARFYYRKSLSVLGSMDDGKMKNVTTYNMDDWKKKEAIAANNIGETFFLSGKNDSARFYLQKALLKKEELNDPDFTLSTYVLLGKLELGMGQKSKALDLLDHSISKVTATDKLSENLNEALTLVTTIINTPGERVSLPETTLKRYFKIQQQQFLALQDLKVHLDKHSVQVEEDLYLHEKDAEILQASLTSKNGALNNLELTIAVLSVSLVLALMIGLPFIVKLQQKTRKTLQDKEAFVKDLISEYDHKIIQLMIVKAEYEEFLGKRKGN